MKYLSIICLLLLHTYVFAQKGDLWYKFYNADSTLAGFKAANGVGILLGKIGWLSTRS